MESYISSTDEKWYRRRTIGFDAKGTFARGSKDYRGLGETPGTWEHDPEDARRF